ncbi:MAG TPA: putative lipid II flippase FtsW [Pseudomonadales bacterium]|nr:putative lipid II flippase FtsW [Pseudomonadales bacterium]
MTAMMPAARLPVFPVQGNYRGNLVWVMDLPLLSVTLALLCLGWVMVSSASIDYAFQTTGDAFYFSKRHGIYIVLSLIAGGGVLMVPYSTWRRIDATFLGIAVLLLLIVLVPGLGRRVNGSQRWLGLGFMTIQVSEIAKWASMVFFAGYLVRRREDMRNSMWGFCKPFLVLGLLAALLLAEPDFGATVVIGASTVALLFLAGAPLVRFLMLLALCLGAVAFLAVAESYRMARLLAFIDPWDEKVMYGSGYQLTQSLIAISRGEWLGVGLGNSVQKLFYLPEAHTDFVFSIWAEETGLAGCVVVVSLFAFMIWRMFLVAQKAAARDEQFGALVATGMALLVGFQAFINMGVTSGLLPTKGLTLPFISYGGSSLMVSAAMSAMVLRLSFENAIGAVSDTEGDS